MVEVGASLPEEYESSLISLTVCRGKPRPTNQQEASDILQEIFGPYSDQECPSLMLNNASCSSSVDYAVSFSRLRKETTNSCNDKNENNTGRDKPGQRVQFESSMS
eukprot:SAG22_NODE_2_length_61565_cov_858.782010_21_plen_106_part_00